MTEVTVVKAETAAKVETVIQPAKAAAISQTFLDVAAKVATVAKVEMVAMAELMANALFLLLILASLN